MIAQVADPVSPENCRRLITMYDRHIHLTNVRDQTGHRVVYWPQLLDAPHADEIVALSRRRTTPLREVTRARHGAARGILRMTIFGECLAQLCLEFQPSNHPFFAKLQIWRPSADQLGALHLVYQSAMHATRAAVYKMPHLDSPALRQRKLRILVDDDGLPGGDTHHYQLTEVFLHIGAEVLVDTDEFTIASEMPFLMTRGFGRTSNFMRCVERLYARSLGPWCLIEAMSVDWMTALCDGLAAHWPGVRYEPYFHECFGAQVEERHAEESVEITSLVLKERPALRKKFVDDARIVGTLLNGVWDDCLQAIVP